MFIELNMRSPYQIFDKLDDASESEKQEKMLSFTLTVISLCSLTYVVSPRLSVIAVLEMEIKKPFSFRREAAGFLTHEGFKTGNHINSTVHKPHQAYVDSYGG